MALYQPSPRFYHCAAQVGERAYLWGGRIQNFRMTGQENLQSEIEMFDSFHETWSKKNVNGVAPPGLFGGACTVVSETLYHFGGDDGHSWYSTLHSLDTVTLDWRALHGHTQNLTDQPMPKSGCGLVTYADAASLVLFAGCGIPNGPTQPRSRFVQSTKFSDGSGWNNEFHLFNLSNRKWTSPTTNGQRPPPCAFFSFTAINHHMAVMFGGNDRNQRFNDVYIIDFHSMMWTKMERPEGASWPVERSSHAATCLNYGDDHPQLLVTGGLDKKGKTLSDAWLLDINTGRWRELTLPEGTKPRWGHTVTSFRLNEDIIHATTFGGCPYEDPNKSDDDLPKLTDTTVMEFESVQSSSSGGTPTSEWVLTGVFSNQGLGTPERFEEMWERKTEHCIGEAETCLKVKIKTLDTENKEIKRQLTQKKSKTSYNSLLGVEVVGEEEVVVTNEAMNFHWEDYGFKLHVPGDALPEGTPEYHVNIKASLSGQFQLPEGYELVSAVYWVATPGKFTKPVRIEAQHCANFSNPSQLCFVRTNCTQKSLPFKFKIIGGGTFTCGSKYGVLSAPHFSGNGIAKEVTPGEHSCQYCAQVYFTAKHLQDYWYCHFVITKDLEMCLTVVKRKYKQEYDIAPPITFGGDHVSLDIPDDGTHTDNGWEIVPLQKAHIKKARVDNFSSEKSWVPECVLLLKWLHRDKPPDPLEYKVKVLGTEEENDFFRIFHHPAAVSQLGNSVLNAVRNRPNAQDTPQAEEPQVELTIDDLLEVTNYLLDFGKTDIHNLGLTLGLNYPHLTKMGGSETFRDDMVAAWLQKEDQVLKQGVPSWKTLVKALKNPRVNQTGVAERIETDKNIAV